MTYTLSVRHYVEPYSNLRSETSQNLTFLIFALETVKRLKDSRIQIENAMTSLKRGSQYEEVAVAVIYNDA